MPPIDSNMPEANKLNYHLKAEDVDPLSSPLIDQLILWSCSVRKNRLVELTDWTRNGSPTAGYDGPKPSYRLRFAWREVQSVDEFEMVNAAVERCFGARGELGWTLWVTGAQLSLLARDFKKEYLKLQEAESTQLFILDIWVENIVDKLKEIEASAEADNSPDHSAALLAPSATVGLDSLSLPSTTATRPRRISSPVRIPGTLLPIPHPRSMWNEFDVSASSSDDDDCQDGDFFPPQDDSDKGAGDLEEEVDEETDEEEEVVFVNETKTRQAKVAATKAAAEKGKGKSKKVGQSTITLKPKKKKAKATLKSAGTIIPARTGRPSKEKSIFPSTPTGTPTIVSPSAAESSTLDVATPSTSGEHEEGGDEEDENATVDFRKKQRFEVWKHFTLVSKYGNAQGLWKCHRCGEDDVAATLNSTSSLLSAARLRCPKVLALITGSTKGNDQATLGGINVVIPPFTKGRFVDRIVEWIAVAGLPFTTSEPQSLRAIFKFLHPDALLSSEDTIARKLEVAYETTEEELYQRSKGVSSVIHYARDDPFRVHATLGPSSSQATCVGSGLQELAYPGFKAAVEDYRDEKRRIRNLENLDKSLLGGEGANGKYQKLM